MDQTLALLSLESLVSSTIVPPTMFSLVRSRAVTSYKYSVAAPTQYAVSEVRGEAMETTHLL